MTAESAHILLEGAPANINLDKVTNDLVRDQSKASLDVHHAHLWSLDGRRSMMTLHARIGTSAGPDVVSRIKARLQETHGIDHATVEVELEDCAGADCA